MSDNEQNPPTVEQRLAALERSYADVCRKYNSMGQLVQKLINENQAQDALIAGADARIIELKEQVATQTTNNQGKTPTISYLNDAAPKPKYDPSKMSPEYFVQELEEYFSLRNIPKENWVKLIGRIFPEDSELHAWWIAEKTRIKTWPAFTEAFIDYETVDLNTDLLNKNLYSKTQKFSEPFEQYAWDTRALFHKVDPEVEEQDVVDRIINSCLPEIATGLATYQSKTVVELVKHARNVIMNINKIRTFERKPLLRIRQSDPATAKPNASSKTKFDSTTQPNSNSSKSEEKSSESATTSQSSRTQNSRPTCSYCKKFGHAADECRTKKRAEERRANASSQPTNQPEN